VDCTQIFTGLAASLVLSLLGLVGTILPALPGTPLILAGILAYGLMAGFSRLTPGFLAGEFALTGITFLVDYIATAYGTRRAGGSRAAVWGAVAGTFLGLLAGPWGILVGPLLGAIAGELLMGKELADAFRSGVGSFLGFLGGTVVKLLIAGIMIAWFLRRIGPDVNACMPWNGGIHAI